MGAEQWLVLTCVCLDLHLYHARLYSCHIHMHIQEYVPTSEGRWGVSQRQRSLCRTMAVGAGRVTAQPVLTPEWRIFRTWVTTPSIETSIPAMSFQYTPALSIFELLSIQI